MLKNPIRYSPDVETIGPDEQETIDGLNKTFSYIVEKTHEDLGHAQRGVHGVVRQLGHGGAHGADACGRGGLRVAGQRRRRLADFLGRWTIGHGPGRGLSTD